jgi:predicted ArsR family transcriptional regulator
MAEKPWVDRVLGSTRAQILSLLCRGPRTVGELSTALALTASGVRGHLTALETEGLVQQVGARRGIGKPAHVFELTGTGRSLLSSAYVPVLQALLEVLAQREALDELFRAVGLQLASDRASATGDFRARVETGVAILGTLGGIGTIEEADDGLVIAGTCCPLGEIVPEYPQACKLIEALLEHLLGHPVVEFCHKVEPLKCRFQVLH